jgi:ABC-type glycerol-3-phosphate transport system substrate-binding protein
MKGKFALIALLILFVIAGCGGPKAEVSIFMMGPQGTPTDVADKLKSSLITKAGPSPTIDLVTSPIFSLEKMIVEIAAGEHQIIILPEEQFRGLGQQGGYVSLDDLVKPEDYKEGILEATDKGKTEKHLYGIPLESTKWFKDLGYNGKGLYAFIPQNAKEQEKAKQVIKLIAEK